MFLILGNFNLFAFSEEGLLCQVHSYVHKYNSTLVGFAIWRSSIGCTNAFLGVLPFSSISFEVLALSVTTGY